MQVGRKWNPWAKKRGGGRVVLDEKIGWEERESDMQHVILLALGHMRVLDMEINQFVFENVSHDPEVLLWHSVSCSELNVSKRSNLK